MELKALGRILSVFITADPTVNNEETRHKSWLRHRYEGNPCRSFVEGPSWAHLTLPSRNHLEHFCGSSKRKSRCNWLKKKKTRQYIVYLAINDLSTSGQSDYLDKNTHLTCCWPPVLLVSYDLHNLHSNCTFQPIHPLSSANKHVHGKISIVDLWGKIFILTFMKAKVIQELSKHNTAWCFTFAHFALQIKQADK